MRPEPARVRWRAPVAPRPADAPRGASVDSHPALPGRRGAPAGERDAINAQDEHARNDPEPQDAARPSGNAVYSVDPLWALAEIGRIDLAADDLNAVLRRVVDLAKRVLPGAREVSVTLITNGVADTAAYTGELALMLDERQYDVGYGPCLDAALQESVFLIRDMASETRWPAFTADALRHGASSSLSVAIPLGEPVAGALNIYADTPDAFDDDTVALAKTFAGYAGVAMANATLFSRTAALAVQMEQAMASRAVIEQAKGILVAQQGVTPEEAFGILSRASQAANRKVRDIAQVMVDKASDGAPGDA